MDKVTNERIVEMVQQKRERIAKAPVILCPSTDEVWLEYGYVKAGLDTDMLWYNEGNANEFNIWFRALMTKRLTNEPRGDLYFQMWIGGQCDAFIVCKDTAITDDEAHDGRRIIL